MPMRNDIDYTEVNQTEPPAEVQPLVKHTGAIPRVIDFNQSADFKLAYKQ